MSIFHSKMGVKFAQSLNTGKNLLHIEYNYI